MHRAIGLGQKQLAAENVNEFIAVGRARPMIRFGWRRLEDLCAQFLAGEQRCHSHIQLARDEYVLEGIWRNRRQTETRDPVGVEPHRRDTVIGEGPRAGRDGQIKREHGAEQACG